MSDVVDVEALIAKVDALNVAHGLIDGYGRPYAPFSDTYMPSQDPVDPAELDDLEARFGVALPADYRWFLTYYRPTSLAWQVPEPGSRKTTVFADLLSVAGIDLETKRITERVMLDRRPQELASTPENTPQNWFRELVPFAGTNGSSSPDQVYCFDYRSSRERPPVVAFSLFGWVDEFYANAMYWVAGSFTDMILSLPIIAAEDYTGEYQELSEPTPLPDAGIEWYEFRNREFGYGKETRRTWRPRIERT